MIQSKEYIIHQIANDIKLISDENIKINLILIGGYILVY